jgi:hypothetical protein
MAVTEAPAIKFDFHVERVATCRSERAEKLRENEGTKVPSNGPQLVAESASAAGPMNNECRLLFIDYD